MEEYLKQCVVDIPKRTFTLTSNESKTLELVCIECVEAGFMTKDLAILIEKNQKFLTTNQFLDTIDGNLKKKLN